MSAVIGSLRAEMEAEVARFREDMGKAAQAVEEFQRRASQAGDRLDRYNRRVRESEQSLDRLAKKAQEVATRFGRFMTVGVTTPILAAGTAIIRTAGNFEQSMNRVGALTGATGDDFDRLRARAREMGAATVFSASESADALGFLAMAGFDVEQQIAALPGTLQLAAAAQMDLGRTADIVTNILTGYRRDVSQLAETNDVLVATFTGSNTSLEQLGEAFMYAGPLAAAAGLEFEETAAFLGLLGNAGFQASQGGTALRGAIARLMNMTPQVSRELEELGVRVTDAEGRMLPLAAIMLQLADHADDVGLMMRVFGQRAGPAMAAALAQGNEELQRLRDRISEAGGMAQDVADRQMEGLYGQLRQLKSAAEELMLAIADAGLLQALTDMATRLTELVRRLNETNPEMLRMVTIGAALLAAIGPIALAVAGLIRILRGMAIILPIVSRALVAFNAGLQASALSARGLTARLFLLWGAWEAGQAIGRSDPAVQLADNMAYALARMRLSTRYGREAVDEAIESHRAQRQAQKDAADSAEDLAQAALDAGDAQAELAISSGYTTEELQAMLDALDDTGEGIELTDRRLSQLESQIRPVRAAIREYTESLTEAVAAGYSMQEASEALAEAAVSSAGGWEVVLESAEAVPAAMRAAAEAMRDAEAQKAAEGLTAQVEGLDRQVRRLALDTLPPLERELAAIDMNYGDLADSIREQIAENEKYADSNDTAAASVVRLRAQLRQVEEAHRSATAAAEAQHRAMRAIDSAFAQLDASRLDSEMRRLREARGDFGVATSSMQELIDIEEDLRDTRLRALVDVRALEADLQEARRLGDTEAIADLEMLLGRQREFMDLVNETTSAQILGQRRIRELVENIRGSVQSSMADLLTGLQEQTRDFDYSAWARDLLGNLRRAVNEHWAKQITEGLFERLGFGGGQQKVGTMIVDRLSMPATGLGMGGAPGGDGGVLGGLASFASKFAGFFAEGGRIPAGGFGIVGENGPELAFAGAGGMNIRPMDQAGGSQVTQVFNITTPDPNGFRRSERQIMQSARRGLGQ